jgi:hypothetical protein
MTRPELFETRYWKKSPLAVPMRWDRWHVFSNDVPWPTRYGPRIIWTCRDGPAPEHRTTPTRVKVVYPHYKQHRFPSDLYIN